MHFLHFVELPYQFPPIPYFYTIELDLIEISLVCLKILNDLKNVSRHCGGHYNIKIKHFEHFSGGAPGAPPMSSRVNGTRRL